MNPAVNSNNSDSNLFLLATQLWVEMANLIGNYDEMIIISPFIEKRQLSYLQEIIENFDKNKEFKIKILTTTFDGSMRNLDLEALKNFIDNLLDSHPGVRINLKIENGEMVGKNRLHAKAYIFRNDEQRAEVIFNGSSNFTYVGMNTAEEWNIKVTRKSNPEICAQIDRRFKFLWDRKKEHLADITENTKVLDLLQEYKDYYNCQESKKIINDDRTNTFRPHIFERKKIGRSVYLQYAMLNNKYLIEKFIKIIDTGKLVEENIVNNLFIVSFVATHLKLRSAEELSVFLEENKLSSLEKIVFKSEYKYVLEEIKKILEHCLKSTNLINNVDLKHSFFTYQQCEALAMHANYKDLKNWHIRRRKGVDVSKAKNSAIALFTEENPSSSKHGYNDIYDREKEEMKWWAPGGKMGWKRGKNSNIRKRIEDKDEVCLLFHKTEELKSLPIFGKNDRRIYYEFLGRIKLKEEYWSSENQGIFRLSSKNDRV